MKSGEELIAGLTRTKDGNYKLHRPMVFKTMVSPDLFGGMKEIFMLKNWLILSTDKQTTITKDSINALLEPSKDVVFLYESEMKKEDKYKYSAKPVKRFPPVFEDTQLPDNIPNSLSKQDELLQRNLEKMLEEMMNIPEQDSNLKDLAKPRKDDKMVFMNLVFSPEVIVELLRSGLLSRKEFGEMVNEITNENGEGMHPNKFTGNKKDKKNLGNDWTDWNPDPSSDDYK
jgi:hypothetical protein